MSFRVLNLTNGDRIKRAQAVRHVEQCNSVWVEEGFSIRDLTLPEIVAARSKQARLREPLAYAEVRGVVYRPAWSNEAGHRKRTGLVREANDFVKLMTEQHSARESA